MNHEHEWVETRWYWSDQKLFQELTCSRCGKVSLGWTHPDITPTTEEVYKALNEATGGFDERYED